MNKKSSCTDSRTIETSKEDIAGESETEKKNEKQMYADHFLHILNQDSKTMQKSFFDIISQNKMT